MAQSLVENTVSYLQKLQDEMMVAGITRIKSQIQAVNEDLLTVKLDLDFLKRQLQGNRDWNSYNATLAASVLQDKTNQLRTLTEMKRLLLEQLSPTVTFPTKIVGDLTVSEDPVSPKKSLIIGVAILLGLFGGIFIAFLHNAVSKGNA